jgi:hypothetical protein
MVPVRVVEIVPVREVPVAVVEIVPVLVVEIVPAFVVEMVPVFPQVVADIAVTNNAAKTINLTFFIVLLLVIRRSGLLNRPESLVARAFYADLLTNFNFVLFKGCARTRKSEFSL